MNNKKQKLVPEFRFPEFMNDGDWEEKKLDNIAKVVASGDLDSDKFSVKKTDKHIYPIYSNSIKNEGIYGFNTSSKYKGGTVTITARGTLGVAFFRQNEFVGIGRLLVVSDFKDVSPIFFKENWNYFAKIHIENGGIPQLTAVKSRLTTLLYPTKKEQQKIANCLSSLDTIITAATEKLGSLKDHKKGLLQQLFPANGESKPQFRFPEFEGDGDFEVNNLGEICKYSNGGSNENNVIDNGKYYLISLNSIDIEGNLKPDMKRVNYIDNSLIKNDLIMVLSDVAYGNFLGLSAIIPNNNYVLNQRMAGLRVRSNQNINIEYLRLFINNNQKYFKRKGQGSSQQNLSKPSVEKFPVLLPNNPKEQLKIANCLSSLDDLIEAQTEKIEALKAHKKGLLQQLFPLSEP